MIPVRPENSKFTPEQWQAIYEEGTNLLVSASAGSGKTTVLTTRIIEKLKRGIHIDELLVVTYTNAAAKEMSERIEHALKVEINKSADATVRKHLQRQLLLLPQANISTLHAFCLTVIRKYFYLIDLDPVFKLLSDEIDIHLFKTTVWHDLKEKLYQDESFVQIAKAYSSDKYDNSLDELVFKLYTFAQASPNPTVWLSRISELYAVEKLNDSPLYQQFILPYIKQVIRECLQALQGVKQSLQDVKELSKNYDNIVNDIDLITVFSQYLDGDYDKLFEQEVSFSTWGRSSVKDDMYLTQLKTDAKRVRDGVKKEIEKIKETYFNGTQQRQVELLQGAKEQIDYLAKVVGEFSRAYETAKLEEKVLEFSDLEHLTLKILQDETVKSTYQNQFKEILVDEYQDINKLQEAIIQNLSNGSNLFMVGDVKQSIYAFRLSDPNLFLNKYLAFKNNVGGKCILLKENFRSRAQILNGINFIFEQLMDNAVGEMTYDHDAMLKHGNLSYTCEDEYHTELLLYEEDADIEPTIQMDDKVAGEIHTVATKIKTLIETNFKVSENGKRRVMTYQDIALLLPTAKYNNLIKEIFEQYAIPVNIVEQETYFERSEVLIMLSILKIIDNPYQDIPLVSVLRSPIIQLDDNALAAIRINDQTSQYYQSVEKFLSDYANGLIISSDFYTAIYEKLTKFKTLLNKWRTFIKTASLVELIWEIYNDTLFLDYVLGLSNGEQRQANLYEFYHYAKKYEQQNIKSLFQFVHFMEQLQQKDFALNEAPKIKSNADAVEVMTIHKSKGLEFPIVFLMGISGKFNKDDLKETILLEDYGLGTYFYNSDKKYKYKTLVQKVFYQLKNKKILAEEMRKLYVALTRAKEQLYIVGRCNNQVDFYDKFSQFTTLSDVVLPSLDREKALNFLTWLCYTMLRSKTIQNDFYSVENMPLALAKHQEQFRITFTNSGMFMPCPQTKNSQAIKDEPIDKAVDIDPILQVMQYRYPFETETKTTTYQSVSELKRLFEDPDIAQLSQENYGRYVQQQLAVPKFLKKQQRITPAIIGTATHQVLQTIDLSQGITQQHIEKHIAQLVSECILDQSIAERIKISELVTFFESELGQMIIENYQRVKREVPFSAVVKAKKLFKSVTADDDILIHGIVDGYIAYEDSFVLYDFKTDFVTDNNVYQVINRYKGQLKIYAEILAQLTGKKIDKVYLCLLSYGKNIDVTEYI